MTTVTGTTPHHGSGGGEIPVSQSSDNFVTPPPNKVHTRTGENWTRIWLWAITPLILHLLSVLTLIIVIKTFVDGQDFNLQSRKAMARFTPLQSDITTVVSGGVAIVRSFAAMWSASIVWRCIFMLMKSGGISLEQIDLLLTWQVHLRPRLKSSQRIGLLISIITLVAFPCHLSGPILTGSITWSSSHRPSGKQEVVGIEAGYTGDLSDVAFSYLYPLNYSASPLSLYSVGRPLAASFAGTAWQSQSANAQTMKRVIRSVAHLPINSTLNNVTLPYFAVTKLEWIKDPVKELRPALLQSYLNDSDWNPFRSITNYISMPGTFALIPDTWGVLTPPDPDTGIVSEKCIVVGKYSLQKTCDDSPFGGLPPNIGPYVDTNITARTDCYIYGRISYVAGAAECRDCRISAWLTVQNDTSVTVLPSVTTMYALGMMPVVAELMREQNVSLPIAFNNLNVYVTELLMRSYASSWTYLTNLMSDPARLPTYVQIAVPTSRANVLWWRVLLWLSLNLMFTISGLIFLIVQRLCNQPLIGNPSLAALLLDTTEILHKGNRGFCNFSTLVEDDKGIGYLYLPGKAVDGTHKRVEIVHD